MFSARAKPFRWLGVAVAILLGVFFCLPAQAQDLAELARKERARRAKVAKKAKVVTAENIDEVAPKGSGSLTTLEGNAASSDDGAATSVVPSDAARADWKQRADAARAQLAAAEQKLKDLEKARAEFMSDLAPLSAVEAQDPMRLQKREAQIAGLNEGVELQKLLVVQARKDIAVLEDTARKNGVPPGWLR